MDEIGEKPEVAWMALKDVVSLLRAEGGENRIKNTGGLDPLSGRDRQVHRSQPARGSASAVGGAMGMIPRQGARQNCEETSSSILCVRKAME